MAGSGKRLSLAPCRDRRGNGLRWLVAGLALAGSCGVSAAALTDAEQRGKQIYLTGSGTAGPPITAYVSAAKLSVPATAMPCASCHGKDGRGREESGVKPSDIRWSLLTRVGGGRSPSGREHPAYDVEAVKRAIRTGVDAGGKQIDLAMPRFTLSNQDLDDLVAYLQRLEEDRDPGIGEDRLRIATVVPAGGPMAAAGAQHVGVLQAYFDEINAAGGIYNRRIELEVRKAASPEQALAQLNELAQGDVFALVGPFTSGIDDAVRRIAEERQLPLIAPFTAESPTSSESLRFSFYLLAGHEVQARALVDFAASRVPDPTLPLVVIETPGSGQQQLVEAFVTQGLKWDWRNLHRETLAVGDDELKRQIEALRDANTTSVFFTGNAEALGRLLAAADAGRWWPLVYALGSSAGPASLNASKKFQRKIYLAFPTALSDLSKEGWETFMAFHGRHELGKGQRLTQLSAYVTARMLVDALKRSGRELSRDRLVAEMERMYRYETGLFPPLTYNVNRRVGAYGAHVIAADLERHTLAGDSTWIEPH